MKKIIFYIATIIFLISSANLTAQDNNLNKVKLAGSNINKVGNELLIDMNLNLDNLDLKSQEMVIVTPVLRSNDNNRNMTLDPVIITGAKREKAVKRAIHFEDYAFEKEPREIIRRNKQQNILLRDTVMYESWMRNAKLIFEEELLGCNCQENDRREMLARLLPPAETPQFHLAILIPPVEPIKQRSETYDAYLNFVVDKYDLLRNYKNNAEVLDEVNMIVNDIRSDENLEVREFKVVGYASPEGNIESNLVLSRNRALSFVGYLRDAYGIDPAQIEIDWKGEDWDGLRKVVENLDIPEKYDVLSIIDADADRNITKRKLKQLNGGTTYRMLLDNYYPALRRNEYTVSYIAQPFDLEKARQVIWTNPHHLSLNEMFLVAQSYPTDSEEYTKCFQAVSQIYPNDLVAHVIMAMPDHHNENYEAVITRLEGNELKEALNNLGIAYAYQQNFEKAKDCFNKAMAKDCEEARMNAELLTAWIEDLY